MDRARGTISIALLLVACRNERSGGAAERLHEVLLRERVASELTGIVFGVAGEAVRGDRRAIIVWPALRDGQPLDDDMAAYVYRREGTGWTLVQGNVAINRAGGREELARHLGGEPAFIARPCGLPEGEMAGHLEKWARAWKDAVDGSRPAEAIAAYEQFARAFAWDQVAFDDLVPELLLGIFRRSRWYCATKGCTAEVDLGGRHQATTFAFESCGTGKVLGKVLPAQP